MLKNLIMATVSAKVFEHHKKADGTINVKIVIYHKGWTGKSNKLIYMYFIYRYLQIQSQSVALANCYYLIKFCKEFSKQI